MVSGHPAMIHLEVFYISVLFPLCIMCCESIHLPQQFCRWAQQVHPKGGIDPVATSRNVIPVGAETTKDVWTPWKLEQCSQKKVHCICCILIIVWYTDILHHFTPYVIHHYIILFTIDFPVDFQVNHPFLIYIYIYIYI